MSNNELSRSSEIEKVDYQHPGLSAVHQILSTYKKARILDLGQTSASSFNFYISRGYRISFEDLGELVNRTIDPDKTRCSTDFIEHLDRYLSNLEQGAQYDAILSWDIFCFLDNKATQYLSARLSEHCHNNTLLHMVRYWGGKYPLKPCNFQTLDAHTAHNDFSNHTVRQHSKLPPVSTLHKTMPEFKLNRHYINEIGMHPSMTEAVFGMIKKDSKSRTSNNPAVSANGDVLTSKKVTQLPSLDTSKSNVHVDINQNISASALSSNPLNNKHHNTQRQAQLKARRNHQSPILPKLFNANTLMKRKKGDLNILDLDQYNGNNAKFYRYFSSQAIFVNIPKLLETDGEAFEKIPALLPMRQALKFDIIMGWDILCRCKPAQTEAIMNLLKPHLKPCAQMHLLRHVGSNKRFSIEKHEILSPRYLEIKGQEHASSHNTLSMIQLISAIRFGTIEQSSLLDQGMQPDINEYIISFNIH